MNQPIEFGPETALIVVDMQHDFAHPTGALYVEGGDDTIRPICELIIEAEAAGALVVYSQDWHPANTPHFAKDGGVWPVHCVAGTSGAAFVPELPIVGEVIQKGVGKEDGYSAFSIQNLETNTVTETVLRSLLFERDIREVVVVGLAGDWCVKETALDAARFGFDVQVPLALTRFVNLNPDDEQQAIAAMRKAGIVL